MTDNDINYEMCSPPQDPVLIARAMTQPGGWVYEIDWNYPDNQRVPPEAIRGGWEVNFEGVLTGKFMRNNRYRAVCRSTRLLKPYMHNAAKNNPEQWIVEIDPSGEALFPNIPESLIRGWWYVGKDGRLTDQFRPNSLWESAGT